jgi:predicted glycoside hydrolase/deacetylase ChbG (UPF0249 family)
MLYIKADGRTALPSHLRLQSGPSPAIPLTPPEITPQENNMATRIILNADDFGLTTGVNATIQRLCKAGVLTSATLMANGEAFEDAVRIARTNPGLGVGCHIVLTDGVPVSPPELIPTLLHSDGKQLRPKLVDFVRDLLLGRINAADIEREALAQVRKLQLAGINITHLDTHKHTHLFPQVARPLLRVAEANVIRAIRNPFEPQWTRRLNHGSTLRRAQMYLLDRLRRPFNAHPQIRGSAVLTTDGSIGVSATGELDAASLAQIMAAAPEGTWELVCHPGANDTDLDRIVTRLRAHREVERDALLAVVPEILSHPNPPQLINYSGL